MTFQLVLKDLHFVHARKSRNTALLEREEIVNWRRRYLEKIRYYRASNRPIYYLDDTWIDWKVNSPRDAFLTTAQKEPSGKCKRLIVLHIGLTDGFVPGGLLFFESKTKSADHHDEINDDTFFEWFKKILPLFKDNAVIVMKNASYQSAKKYLIPVMSWKKQDIIQWLENKGVIITQPIIKVQLLEKVGQLKLQYDKYVIDEYANDHNKIVLRIPPYHCEINPVELAWSSVISHVWMHNKTFKLNDVVELLKSSVECVTPDMWTNFVGHIIKEEEKLWNIDFLTDEIMDEEPEVRHVFMIETDDTCSD